MEQQDRVVLISGATGGLGQVVVEWMANAGARLALVSRNEHKLNALAQKLSLADERVKILPADLADPNAAQHVVQETVDAFGKLEVVIHLVGGWTGGEEVTAVKPRELAEMLVNHVWTTFHLAQASLPALKENGWGRWLVVSSPAAGRPPAKMSAYAVAKAAQETLLLSMARELKGSGVTANVLRVQTIDVEHEKLARPDAKNASWTTPEEISAALLYLCSDAAGTVNGAVLPLNGAP